MTLAPAMGEPAEAETVPSKSTARDRRDHTGGKNEPSRHSSTTSVGVSNGAPPASNPKNDTTERRKSISTKQGE